MENSNESNGFSYTYSAREQEELKRIREKYTNREEDKLVRLRRLDASVTHTAQIAALAVGIIGALILGLGMSLCMTDLAKLLGLQGNSVMIVGIVIGVVGGALASLAYPIYHAIVKAKRKRVAPEILRLTDELMK